MDPPNKVHPIRHVVQQVRFAEDHRIVTSPRTTAGQKEDLVISPSRSQDVNAAPVFSVDPGSGIRLLNANSPCNCRPLRPLLEESTSLQQVHAAWKWPVWWLAHRPSEWKCSVQENASRRWGIRGKRCSTMIEKSQTVQRNPEFPSRAPWCGDWLQFWLCEVTEDAQLWSGQNLAMNPCKPDVQWINQSTEQARYSAEIRNQSIDHWLFNKATQSINRSINHGLCCCKPFDQSSNVSARTLNSKRNAAGNWTIKNKPEFIT